MVDNGGDEKHPSDFSTKWILAISLNIFFNSAKEITYLYVLIHKYVTFINAFSASIRRFSYFFLMIIDHILKFLD